MFEDDAATVKPKNMTFGMALVSLKQGYRVTRRVWRISGVYIFMVTNWILNSGPEDAMGLPREPFIAIKASNNTVMPWVMTGEAAFAEDWEIQP